MIIAPTINIDLYILFQVISLYFTHPKIVNINIIRRVFPQIIHTGPSKKLIAIKMLIVVIVSPNET